MITADKTGLRRLGSKNGNSLERANSQKIITALQPLLKYVPILVIIVYSLVLYGNSSKTYFIDNNARYNQFQACRLIFF